VSEHSTWCIDIWPDELLIWATQSVGWFGRGLFSLDSVRCRRPCGRWGSASASPAGTGSFASGDHYASPSRGPSWWTGSRSGGPACPGAGALRPPRWQLHADSVDLAGKLQIKPGQSVALVNPPPGLVLPSVVAAAAAADADAVVAFVARQEDLDSAVAAARADRLAWIGYPKGGRLGTDLNRDRLAAALAVHGVQPGRQVSIDDTWSALRFRPAEK
jgi:hypothetical protein